MTQAVAKARKPRHTTTPARPKLPRVADLLDSLGGVPAARVLWNPLPGTATEADLVRVCDTEDTLVELVEGTLVEKAMGTLEGRIGHLVGHWVEDYLEDNELGICFGGDSPMRLKVGLVRLPDVSFVAWDRLPNREVTAEPVQSIIPDLAVEVLSKSNTRKEMERKRREYFAGGCKVVWEIDPRKQTARVYTAPDTFTEIGLDDDLRADVVLPAFRISLRKLFERAKKGLRGQ